MLSSIGTLREVGVSEVFDVPGPKCCALGAAFGYGGYLIGHCCLL